MVEDNKVISQSNKVVNKRGLQPGHTLSQGKRKPGGGRKKRTDRLLRECIGERKPELIEKAIDLALNAKDERVRADATFKLLAYVEGAPPSKTDITLRRGVDDRTPEDIDQMAKLLEAALANQRQLLSPPDSVEDNALQE